MSYTFTNGIGSLNPVQSVTHTLPGVTGSHPVQPKFKPGDVIVSSIQDTACIRYVEDVFINHNFGDAEYRLIELSSEFIYEGYEHDVRAIHMDFCFAKWEDAIVTSSTMWTQMLYILDEQTIAHPLQHHTHTWKLYQGLIEQYEYCTECDTKKDNT